MSSDSSEEDNVNLKGGAGTSSSTSHSGLSSYASESDTACSSPGSGAGDLSDLSHEDNCPSPPFSPLQRRGLKRNLYASHNENPSKLVPRQTTFRREKLRCEDESEQAHGNSSADNEETIARTNAESDVEEHQAPQTEELVSDNSHSSHNPSIYVRPCHDFPNSFNDSSDEETDSVHSNNSDMRDEFSDVEGSANESSIDLDELDSNDEDCDLVDLLQDEISLYPGSSKTRDEAVLELLNIYLKNNLSKRTLTDMLKFFTSSLPEPHSMPSTVHSLMKYIEEFSTPMYEVEHLYCRPAMHAVESKEMACSKCGSCDFGVFYELRIESRLKFLFEHHGLADSIDQYSETRNGRDGHKIYDIVDGFEYSRIRQNDHSEYKITLIMNPDGVRPHKGSKAKMWPLMFSIMEIPPHLRASFTLEWGVWFDKNLKPNMNLYLEPFIASLVKIHNEGGISWRHPTNLTHHRSPVHAPVMIADAPARAAVLNMQEHQSKYACNACEQKTSKLTVPPAELGVKREIRKRRFLFKEDPAQLRTHESMVMHARYASERGRPKKGFKGRSVVENLPLIDLSTYVLAEYMHCVLTGVVDQICSLWFFSKGDWYIGDHLTDIDKFLCNEIHPPDYVSRLPRSLENFAHFKANEFRSFLLYYSLVVFPYLPNIYLQHWMLLVQAMFILLSDIISEEDLVAAEAMIRLFVRDVGALYGDKNYTYNMHQMNHLVSYTRRWGCLWGTSAFGFESFNGTLSKMIHGSKHEGRQLINSTVFAQASQLLKTKIVINAKRDKAITTYGKPLSYPLSESESLCLSSFETGEETIQFYSRILVGRETFSSQKYDKNFKRRNSFVEVNCNGQKKFGRIIVFCKVGVQIVCFISIHRVVHHKFFFHRDTRTRVKHIITIEKTDEIVACTVQNIQRKLIEVGNYLCFKPNAIESNL